MTLNARKKPLMIPPHAVDFEAIKLRTESPLFGVLWDCSTGIWPCQSRRRVTVGRRYLRASLAPVSQVYTHSPGRRVAHAIREQEPRSLFAAGCFRTAKPTHVRSKKAHNAPSVYFACRARHSSSRMLIRIMS